MRRIIILDDDDDLRQLLTELAADIGCICGVCAASVGDLQSHAAEALSCDLALLDVNLGPGVPSGVDAYGWLRAQGYRGEVVFFTGHARSYPLLTEALAAPNVSLLVKPVDCERLEALLAGGA
jgi:response regulator of citrate/malate metabolism